MDNVMTAVVPGKLSERDQEILLDLAEASIRKGVYSGQPMGLTGWTLPGDLLKPGASFVTLHAGDALRGCIGSPEPIRALAEDVVANAYFAARCDPRFPPVTPDELPSMTLEISVLGPMEPIHFENEQDIYRQLRPGIDGVRLRYGMYQGLFLPVMWQQLPEPEVFWANLKLKAGLPVTFWDDRFRVERFTAQVFGRPIMRSFSQPDAT